jgi:acetyl-CoA acetyltransferase
MFEPNRAKRPIRRRFKTRSCRWSPPAQRPARVFAQDKHPRFGTPLKRYRPKAGFPPERDRHRRQRVGINDGAAALSHVGTRGIKAGHPSWQRCGLGAAAGVDPSIMGVGPVPATKKSLARRIALDA